MEFNKGKNGVAPPPPRSDVDPCDMHAMHAWAHECILKIEFNLLKQCYVHV